MKKIFGQKKLKKAKFQPVDENYTINGTNSAESGTSDRSVTDHKEPTSLDEYQSYYEGTSSSLGEERHFDEELDKHMMQTISDVKYVKKRPKFVTVGEVNFQRECLDAHNVVRGQYGCQALIWSQELSDLAHSWAVKLAERGRILFPELPGIGENICLTIADEQTHLPSGTEITELWAREAKDFDFKRPQWSPKTKNFTQIVWKETFEMGIARQWNTNKNCVATVAFYRPPGNSNAPGEFQRNVSSKTYFDKISVPSATILPSTTSLMRSHPSTVQKSSDL